MASNMKARYESLPLKELRAVAKARGLRNISTLRKAQLVDRMLEEDEKDARKQQMTKQKEQSVKEAPEEKAAKQKRPKKEPDGQKQSRQETSEEKSAKKTAAADQKPDEGSQQEKKPVQSGAKKRQNNHRKAASSRSQSSGKGRKSGNSSQHREQNMQPSAVSGSREQSEKQAVTEKPAEETAPQEKGIRMEDLFPSGQGGSATGILEVLPDGYGFIRSANFLPGDNDVYVSPSQIRKFNLKTGDWINGGTRMRATGEKFSALIHINSVNGFAPIEAVRRRNFEDMIPIFPNERIRLERSGSDVSMRIVDLVSPVGKGQRGMIVSPPKAGKTTLLKQIAKSVLQNAPEMHMIILLIDERPEEVTDMKETIQGPNVEVIYSTFDELPEHHKRVSEMVIERAKRLVEHDKDVIILLDSITRLARAYNLTVPPSGRTLSGGLDPAALHMPKRFFGAARNMREGGSLTILATALVDTGSKMDDVVYEEFKGTGNMELILDRKLSERRIFPAIDIIKSGTRREDLLLSQEEREASLLMRRSLNGMKAEEASEQILNLFVRTRSNKEFCDIIRKRRY